MKGALDLSKKAYVKKWFNLLHYEELYERETRCSNEKDDPSFYLVELENLDQLRETVQERDLNDESRPVVLKFSKTFGDKDSIHAFLDNFKQMDYVSLIQNSLSCTLKGNITEKRMKKVKQENKKFFIGYLLIRCYLNDSIISSQKLEFIDCNETQTLWKVDNKRKSFFPLMRYNILELVLNQEFERKYQLIVQLQPPLFDESEQLLKPFEPLYKKDRGLNEDQMNTIEKVKYGIILF